MTNEWAHATLMLGGSLVSGTLIGVEREHRNQPAGLRTLTLVGFTAALLTTLASHPGLWWASNVFTHEATSRIVQGVVTGIGFIGAGAIFRHGRLTHGLATAAAIWTVSAIGVLYGAGAWPIAAGATAATLVVLVCFRLVDKRIPRYLTADLTVRYGAADALDEAQLRAALQPLQVQVLAVSHHREEGLVEHKTVLGKVGALDGSAVCSLLAALPQVRGYTFEPHEA